jgi:drug/metabolite transporter (DMT)-like permease
MIAAVFVFLNYVLLSQAYKHIELSLAYPISRSSTLFLPLVAFLLLRETIDRIGWLSIVLILSGVFLMYVDDLIRHGIIALKNSGLVFALLAALTVACYTVWDKMAITHLHPFVYFYSYTFLTGMFYGLLLLQKPKRVKIHREWSQKKGSIIAVALLNTGTYLLVLFALSLSKAVYVGALRQFSLVFGIFLGWKVLHENISFTRVVGIIVLIAGSTLTLISE